MGAIRWPSDGPTGAQWRYFLSFDPAGAGGPRNTALFELPAVGDKGGCEIVVSDDGTVAGVYCEDVDRTFLVSLRTGGVLEATDGTAALADVGGTRHVLTVNLREPSSSAGFGVGNDLLNRVPGQ